MKVRVIKNKMDANKDIIMMNSDTSELLEIGQNYYVFAISIESEGVYFYLFDDFYLFPVPSQMFEIVESDIPVQWKITNQDGTIFLCPDLFNEPYFYDKFSDHDISLVEKFKSLASEMYPQLKYAKW